MKKYFLSVGIALLCLWLAFRQVEFEALWRALGSADYSLVPFFIGAHVLGMGIRTLRWRVILAPVADTRLGNLWRAATVGFMANFIFPARAGEVIRAWLIGRREKISASTSFATIVLERLFDGFAILSFLAVTPLVLDVPAGQEKVMAGVRLGGMLAFAAYMVIVAVLFLFHRRPALLTRTAELCARPLPSRAGETVRHMASSFGAGLELLGRPRHIAAVLAWSLLLWLVIGSANWFILRAFDLPLPFFAGLFLLVVQSFGVMVPSPGFVGALQYAHVLGLALFGIEREMALSVGILIHGLLFVTYLGMGLASLWTEGVGLGEVRSRSRSGEDGAG